MLIDLFRLYKRNGASKTPLEDFTTEALAGLLRLNPSFLASYRELIKLPEDTFKVVTQKHYFLSDTQDCIVDLVLIGKQNICFIENKVNSSEGWEQLNRYARALSEYYPKHNKYLRYCTKYYDPKNILEHSFHQYTWRQISRLIKNDKSSSVLDFRKFLEYHNMADNYNLDLNSLVAMKNLEHTINMALFHLENSRHTFLSVFSNAEFAAQTGLKAIKEHDRFGYLFKHLFHDTSSWTELLYSINFSDLQISTQIFINKEHLAYELLVTRLKQFSGFSYVEHDSGTSIILIKKLTDLIEDEEVDNTIKKWFHNSFLKFAEVISKTPELNWKIHVNTLLVPLQA